MGGVMANPSKELQEIVGIVIIIIGFVVLVAFCLSFLAYLLWGVFVASCLLIGVWSVSELSTFSTVAAVLWVFFLLCALARAIRRIAKD